MDEKIGERCCVHYEEKDNALDETIKQFQPATKDKKETWRKLVQEVEADSEKSWNAAAETYREGAVKCPWWRVQSGLQP